MRKRLLLPWLLLLMALLLALTLRMDFVQDARAEDGDTSWIEEYMKGVISQLVRERRNCQVGAIEVYRDCLYRQAAGGLRQEQAIDACKSAYDQIGANDPGGKITLVDDAFYFRDSDNYMEISYNSGGGAVSGRVDISFVDQNCEVSITYVFLKGTYSVEKCEMSGMGEYRVKLRELDPDSACWAYKEEDSQKPWAATMANGHLNGYAYDTGINFDFDTFEDCRNGRPPAETGAAEAPPAKPAETSLEEPESAEPADTSLEEPKGAQPVSDEDEGLPPGDSASSGTLARIAQDDLLDLLTWQRVGPTPRQAVEAATATALLMLTWMLSQLSPGASAAAQAPEATQTAKDQFGPLPSADPELVRFLEMNFEGSVQRLLDKGHYVMNRNFPRKMWNWSFGGITNWLRGYKGGQCEEFADLGKKEAKVFAKRLFGEGAIVDTLAVDEEPTAIERVRSKLRQKGVDDSSLLTLVDFDGVYTDNHVATRVILPTGERYILDYWQAVGDRQSDLAGDLAYRIRFGEPGPAQRPRLIPEHEWVQKWRQRIGMDDSCVSISHDQEMLKKDIEHHLDLYKRGKYGIKSEKEALQKAFDQFRRTHPKVADTLINSWLRRSW